jgi:SpoVK/Ycf46/Vps4 family AAA+-type ATPase
MDPHEAAYAHVRKQLDLGDLQLKGGNLQACAGLFDAALRVLLPTHNSDPRTERKSKWEEQAIFYTGKKMAVDAMIEATRLHSPPALPPAPPPALLGGGGAHAAPPAASGSAFTLEARASAAAAGFSAMERAAAERAIALVLDTAASVEAEKAASAPKACSPQAEGRGRSPAGGGGAAGGAGKGAGARIGGSPARRPPQSPPTSRPTFTEHSRALSPQPSKEDLELIQSLESLCVLTPASKPVRWTDVVGLEHLKRRLQEALAPIKYAHSGLPALKGVLLSGPPGTGKSFLAQAVATDSGATFLNVHPSHIVDKYVGNSAKNARHLYALAKYYSPSILFMDEIDCIAGERGGKQSGESAALVNELLQLLDGVESGGGGGGGGRGAGSGFVFLMGATNRPAAIDPGMLRRLELKLFLPLPLLAERAACLAKYLLVDKGKKLDVDPGRPWGLVDLAWLTDGFSAADLKTV